MSNTTKEEKQQHLDAIALLEKALDAEIKLEMDLASQAETEQNRAFHVEQQIEYGAVKTGLLKLKAKLLMK